MACARAAVPQGHATAVFSPRWAPTVRNGAPRRPRPAGSGLGLNRSSLGRRCGADRQHARLPPPTHTAPRARAEGRARPPRASTRENRPPALAQLRSHTHLCTPSHDRPTAAAPPGPAPPQGRPLERERAPPRPSPCSRETPPTSPAGAPPALRAWVT